MSNELRSRTAFVGGLVEDNPLTSGATTLTSAGLASLAVIDSTNHAAIIVDPDGIGGAPEIIYVTAHTSTATTATIARGKEGSTARQHAQDTPWIHSATLKEFDGAGGGTGLIGLTSYNSSVSVSATSTSFVNVDATNLQVSFTAPPSGKVLVVLTGFFTTTGSGSVLAWNVRESGSDVAGTNGALTYHDNSMDFESAATRRFVVTGLTPGSAHTYTWGHARTLGSSPTTTQCGGTLGQGLMEVWAVNV